MTNLVDNFTRANSVLTLNPPSDGINNWSAEGSGSVYGIDSNRGYCVVGLTDIFAIRETSVANGELGVTENVAATNNSGSLIFRYVDVDNLLWVRTGGPSVNDIRLYKRVAGTYTEIGTNPGPNASGDAYKIVYSGNAIEVFQNAVSIISVSEDTHNTATKVGLVGRDDTTLRWTDFYFTGAGGGGSRPVKMAGEWGGFAGEGGGFAG